MQHAQEKSERGRAAAGKEAKGAQAKRGSRKEQGERQRGAGEREQANQHEQRNRTGAGTTCNNYHMYHCQQDECTTARTHSSFMQPAGGMTNQKQKQNPCRTLEMRKVARRPTLLKPAACRWLGYATHEGQREPAATSCKRLAQSTWATCWHGRRRMGSPSDMDC